MISKSVDPWNYSLEVGQLTGHTFSFDFVRNAGAPGGSTTISDDAHAQQVLDRAAQGNWSSSTGRNDALQHTNPPPLPTTPRPVVQGQVGTRSNV